MSTTQKPINPLFTRQALVALLLPLIAEQALSVTIGLADTLMVSSVGEAAVSGVSLVDSFNTLMIQVMSALATGGAVVTSQYIGHREPKNAKAAAAQIMFVLASFSLVVTAVVAVGRHAILRGIFGSIDADVMRYAETYFLLSALSYPFIGLYNAGAALFRAQGNSKISMLSSLVMNVINIGGNAVLIYGFGMGVLGAALASLVSRAVSCLVVLWLLQRPGCALRVDGLRALAPDGGLIRRILRVGIPAGIENGMFRIGKLSVSSLTSTLGTAAIAANAVANTASTFLNIPANAVGMAALTVVGQCLGAGEKEQAVYYSRRLLLTAYCGAWVMNLSAFLFANRFVISLFNLSPEAQTMALQVMVWFNFVSLFFWPSSFTLPNILRAAGDARFTMAVSILSMWVFRVGFCYVMVLGFHGRLLSIWMGMFLDWVFRSLCFFVRFARGLCRPGGGFCVFCGASQRKNTADGTIGGIFYSDMTLSNPSGSPAGTSCTQRCGPARGRAPSSAAFPAGRGSPGASGSGSCCARSIPTGRHRCTCRPDRSGWPPPGRTPSHRRSAGASSCRPARSCCWHSRSSIPDGACCGPCGAAMQTNSPGLRARLRWGCGRPDSRCSPG